MNGQTTINRREVGTSRVARQAFPYYPEGMVRFWILLAFAAWAILGSAEYVAAQTPKTTPQTTQAAKTPSLGKPTPPSNNTFINKYDPKYRPLAYGKDNIPEDSFFFHKADYTISFIRPDGLKPGEAGLRITQPVSVNGCGNVTVPPVRQEQDGPVYWITVGLPQVAVDKSVRYAHYACKVGSKFADTDVILNRDELMAKGTRRIGLKNDLGSETYTLESASDYMRLLYKKNVIFRPDQRNQARDPLTFWFYPENTVILSVPGSEKLPGVEDSIKALAREKGLRPLEETLKNFEGALKNGDLFYFTDTQGNLVSTLKPDAQVLLGTITIEEPWNGPNGPTSRAKTLDVTVRRPGLWE